MNENYLRFFTTYSRDLDYPILDTSWILKEIFTPRDYSFLKQELKPMSFLPEERRVFTINFDSMCDEEMEYFKRRLIESLRAPTHFNHTPPTDYFDEYH